MGEGMPAARNPTECGNLMIKFNIKFPAPNWASEEQLKVRKFSNKFVGKD